MVDILMNSERIFRLLTCGVYMWGDSQEHWASIGRKSSLNHLQETTAVKTPCSVCNGSHACLPLHA